MILIEKVQRVIMKLIILYFKNIVFWRINLIDKDFIKRNYLRVDEDIGKNFFDIQKVKGVIIFYFLNKIELYFKIWKVVEVIILNMMLIGIY